MNQVHDMFIGAVPALAATGILVRSSTLSLITQVTPLDIHYVTLNYCDF